MEIDPLHVFLTGVTGYIGGSVAQKLIASGHRVSGLVRSEEKAAQLRELGIEPVRGTLSDLSVIAEAATRADAAINTANSDDYGAAEALVNALKGSGKTLVHTSGTSVVADRAAGEYSDAVFNEDSPFEPLPERMLRVAIERMVLSGAQHGLRTIVIRPSLIYGRGTGLNPDSLQLPKLIGLAQEHGIARHVGRGLNVWSHVHIGDAADLYLLALKSAPAAASIFFAENGEAAWKDMASAIGRMLGLGGETKDWPVEEALSAWGPGAITSYGSNSRVRAEKARRVLDWQPKGAPLFEEIERGCYREDFGKKP